MYQSLEGQTFFGAGETPTVKGEANHGVTLFWGSFALSALSIVSVDPMPHLQPQIILQKKFVMAGLSYVCGADMGMSLAQVF